jgi:plasmid stabilization system protein ParE
MKLRVKTLPRAEADIRSITRYIYERSRHGAAAWLNALDQARLRLANTAVTCGACDENEHFAIDVRQMLFKTRRGRV